MAATLSEAQRVAGRDSRHIWAVGSTLWAKPLSAPRHAALAGLDHFVLRNKRFRAPISIMRDKLRWKVHGALESADIIHLHNVNGLVSVGELARSYPDKRIIWTLHDMNPFTGACHYTLGCSNFARDCASCPAVREPFQALVQSNFRRKLAELDGLDNLHLVSPSRWLGSEVGASRLMSRFPQSVVNNPLNPLFLRSELTSDTPIHTFVVVAQNLEDPVKNVPDAVRAFSQLKRTHPEITMALVGKGGERYAGEGIEPMGHLVGRELAAALRSSVALLVPSTMENAPMVIAEATSQGCLPLARHVGGMPEMIEALGHGRTFSDQQSLLQAMEKVVTLPAQEKEREALRERTRQLYSPDAVRRQYDKVYDR